MNFVCRDFVGMLGKVMIENSEMVSSKKIQYEMDTMYTCSFFPKLRQRVWLKLGFFRYFKGVFY